MNENDSIKNLEEQAKNTKYLIDRLNTAYLGMTTDELIKLALSSGEKKDDAHD